MSNMPKKMVFGLGLGLLGGILALGGMAYAWDGTTDTMALVGLNMLVSCMFFAVGGCFTKYAPVQGSSIAVLAAVCEAAVILSILYDATYIGLNLILAVIGAALILIGACPNVSAWIDAKRIA